MRRPPVERGRRGNGVIYTVGATIEQVVEAGTPEEAALEFAERLSNGLYLDAVADRGEKDERNAELHVTEPTADGRAITYYVEVRTGFVIVCDISEHRPFSYRGLGG
jgi:hypothetical protein